MANQILAAVLNPEAQRTPASEGSGASVPSWSMAPRLDSLNGKTVYLVNQGFGGSDLFCGKHAGGQDGLETKNRLHL
jgi:hypothetical protein